MKRPRRHLYRLAVFPVLAILLIILIAGMIANLHPSSSPPFVSSTTTSQSNSSEVTSGNGSSFSYNNQSCFGVPLHNGSRVFALESGSKEERPQQSTGVIVPIFSSYSVSQLEAVNEVISSKERYPMVRILVVLNPETGPGNSFNPGISTEVQSMQRANISVLGYVPTNWGARNISHVEANILTWHNWYHVNGLQLDQTPNWEYTGPQGQWNYSGPNGIYMPSYFANLTEYAKSLGMTIVYGNSGADVPENFMGNLDIIGIFENQFLPAFFTSTPTIGALTGLDGWHLKYNKDNYSFTSYNIQSFDPYFVAAASDYVGYMYFTNGGWPQPYGSLAKYFPELISTLASLSPINIESESISGAPIQGMQMSVTQPNGLRSLGFAPFSFNAISNSSVTATAYNYEGYVFSHWSGGFTNSTITIMPSQAMSLVAYYKQTYPLGCPPTPDRLEPCRFC
jgi:hypothetical protein